MVEDVAAASPSLSHSASLMAEDVTTTFNTRKIDLKVAEALQISKLEDLTEWAEIPQRLRDKYLMDAKWKSGLRYPDVGRLEMLLEDLTTKGAEDV